MKGAIFDMDGLLIDSERVYQQTWRALAEEHGVRLDALFPRKICGTSGEGTLATLREYFPGADPAAVAAECVRRVRQVPAAEIPLKPGAEEILRGLRSLGFQIAIASASEMDLIRANLSAHGLSDYFDVWASGTEVANGKPAPDVFLLAAERLALSPETCYVLEDSRNGILAAHAGGFRPVMVPDLVAPTEALRERCAAVCRDLSEALALICAEHAATGDSSYGRHG